MRRNNEVKFFRALTELEADPRVRELERYRQHRGNPTFCHCHNVAVASFGLAQRLGWRVDEQALARGAMLHDFHLYTRQDIDINPIRHIFRHPRYALRNAERVFALNRKEKNIIRSHMWPLTLLTPPRSREALLVTLADKYCAWREMRGCPPARQEIVRSW